MEDLGCSDILILDGDASGACGVGIESTVAKIDAANDRILILRMGGTTQERIREALKEGGEEFSGISVHAGSVAGGKAEAKGAAEEEEGRHGSSMNEPAEDEGQAPGSVISHSYTIRRAYQSIFSRRRPMLSHCKWSESTKILRRGVDICLTASSVTSQQASSVVFLTRLPTRAVLPRPSQGRPCGCILMRTSLYSSFA